MDKKTLIVDDKLYFLLKYYQVKKFFEIHLLFYYFKSMTSNFAMI